MCLPWGCDLKRVLLTAVIATLAYASVAGATASQIKVADNFFSPRTPPVRNLASGASFTWTRAAGSTGFHNIRQNVRLFRSGDLTSGPINYSVSASAGTYHYYCELHGSPTGGMDGIVKVRPTFLADPTGAPFTVKWALLGTTTGDKFDVRFRVGTATTWTLWRNDTSARSGIFGQNNQPVQVVPGQTYQFQARSENDPTKPSGWSPTLTATP